MGSKMPGVSLFANDSRKQNLSNTFNTAPTSFGESNFVSMMNPSRVIGRDVKESLWSTSVPTSSFLSLKEVTVLIANTNNIGWNSNDTNLETNSDSPIVNSVDINMQPTSYARAAGGSNFEQPKNKRPRESYSKKNLGEPSFLFDFEEVMSIPHNNEGPPPAGPPPSNNNGPPSVVRPNRPAPCSMEELCQPSIHERGRPIASIPIQATDFGLRHHMIQQVQNTCQFHGLPSDDANRHIDKFLEVTQHMKQNGVSDDGLRLSLFPYSLTHHATAWKFRQDPNKSLFEAWERYKLSIDRCPNLNMLLVTQIDTFCNGLTLRHRDTINATAGGTCMQKTPEECFEVIENMTAHNNHWDTSATRDETSRNISSTTTTESPEVVRQLEMMNKNFPDMMRQIKSVKSVNMKCETCGGPHSFTECPAIGGYTQKAAYATTGNHNSRGNSYQPQGLREDKADTSKIELIDTLILELNIVLNVRLPTPY
uniref:Reverse transcriptase domain-containing protein n=1 Tax=Tanacetum cinerariifolium TaxID=118510 RepID=A0A6L2JI21_TANCI|nr:hypothetical protein [Tanacetum cinerariifolium]